VAQTILNHLAHWPPALIYVLAAVVVGSETATVLGLVAPGEITLLVVGFLCYVGTLHLAIALPVMVLGALVGDSLGYLAGRRRTETEWKRAVECWQQLGPTLAEHDVTAAIEPLNRFETFFLNTAEDSARFCDEVNHPNVGILFDTFHANIEEKDIAAGYRTVGKHLKHVHTCENDRGTPGSGHVEWKAVFDAIRDVGYDGWLTIESFGSNLPEIAAAAAIWRDLAATPDEVAFEGVKFIKQMAAGKR